MNMEFCHVQDNAVEKEGALISNKAIIEGCNFTENRSTKNGGAVCLKSNTRSDQVTDYAVISNW